MTWTACIRRCIALLCFDAAVIGATAMGSEANGGGQSFADKLFEASLPYAYQSLHGRFISDMADGILPRSAFTHYLSQDNLYLSKYARVFAILGARATRTDELAWLLNASLGFLYEHGPGANKDLDEMAFVRNASDVTVAYTSFLLQAAWSESPILVYAAALPCQRLYDWLFATLKTSRHIADDNPFMEYINQYADPRNHQLTQMLEMLLNRHAPGSLPEAVVGQAQFYYDQAMRYEVMFFEQGFEAVAATGNNTPAQVVSIDLIAHRRFAGARRAAWLEAAPGVTTETAASVATAFVSVETAAAIVICLILAIGFVGAWTWLRRSPTVNSDCKGEEAPFLAYIA